MERLNNKSYKQILNLGNYKYEAFRKKVIKDKSQWLTKEELNTFLTNEEINKHFPNPNLTRLVKNKNKTQKEEQLYCLIRVKKALEKGKVEITLNKDFYNLFDCQLKKIQKLVEWYSKTPKP